MSKLDDAVAAIMAVSQPQGCWATRLEGDAVQLVARLREEEDAGNKPNRAAVKKVLRDVFDVRVSDDRIRYHLARNCSCE